MLNGPREFLSSGSQIGSRWASLVMWRSTRVIRAADAQMVHPVPPAGHASPTRLSLGSSCGRRHPTGDIALGVAPELATLSPRSVVMESHSRLERLLRSMGLSGAEVRKECWRVTSDGP